MARMTLTGALRSESVRLRRSPLIALHIVLALAVGVAAGLYFATTPWDSKLAFDAFVQLLGAGAPLLVGLACGLSADTERAAGDYANMFGMPSRRIALAAKVISLLGLGVCAAALAVGSFAAVMTVFSRPLPVWWAAVDAVLGIGAGSAACYVLGLFCALKWGRNITIGVGAAGLVVALMSVGGLANGLVTGTLSGAMSGGPVAWLFLVWPLRLASLIVELAIAPGAALSRSLGETLFACIAVTAVVVILAGVLIDRFEDAKHTAE